MNIRALKPAIFAAAAALFVSIGPRAVYPDVRTVGIEDLFRIRNIQDVCISPAGGTAAYVLAEVDLEKNKTPSRIWLVDARSGAPRQLTAGPGRDESPRWAPDGKAIAFLSDRDGTNQIWIISPSGGEASRPAVHEGGVASFAWSPDGRKIAFLARTPAPRGPEKDKSEPPGPIVYDEDVPGLQLFVLDLGSGRTTCLVPVPSAVTDFNWSPGGTEIVFTAQPSPRIPDLYRTDIFAVDLETRTVRDVVRRTGVDSSPRWSPDGRWIAFLSTEGRTEWIANWYLCVVPAGGGAPRNLTPDFKEFLFSPEWSADGRAIFFRSPDGFRNQLFRVAPDSGEIRPLLSGDPVWSDFSFSADTRKAAFLGTDARTPAEVFFSDLDEFAPVRRTFTNPELDGLALGRREIIRWKSTDGLGIEGLLLLPPEGVGTKPYPLLTYVHGGPSGRFAAEFSPQIGSPYPVQAECYPQHLLAGLGIAVFMPNPRGSYGYGDEFRKANLKDWGGGDYRDIMSGIDALIERGIVDPARLGIMGRSYGGYMTGWIITQTNRFKVASLGAGMSNLVSFYGQTDIPGMTEYYLGDVPWKAMDLYLRCSPITHAGAIRTPTLILHGEKDFRVPVPQAQELYQAIKKNGVPVRLVIYPRQGHVAVEPKHMRDMIERNLEWFALYLK